MPRHSRRVVLVPKIAVQEICLGPAREAHRDADKESETKAFHLSQALFGLVPVIGRIKTRPCRAERMPTRSLGKIANQPLWLRYQPISDVRPLISGLCYPLTVIR
jgi:hypothetical protein